MVEDLIPLARPDITDEDIAEAVRVLKTGMLVQGKEVQKLESDVSLFIQTNYCSAVSNGTASLHLALIALGIGPGDEVIIPAFSYIATANVVELVGARCIFVDIHPRYFNIDENKIEQAITSKTKAIIPVHEFGLSSDMNSIMALAEKHNLYVIEDAACALGATYDNKFVGSFGHFGSFSLHPRKAITSGEGGLLATSDPALDKIIKTLRNHGIEPGLFPLNFVLAGYNYRMTDFQAALVGSQFRRLDRIINYRNKLAEVYFSEITNKAILLPKIPPKAKHTWQTFHLLAENSTQRNKLSAYLKENGVLSNYGAQCIPAMSYYHEKYQFDTKITFPEAYRAYSCGLAIPLYERLNEIQIKKISYLINKL
jgi:perosamine synthetase